LIQSDDQILVSFPLNNWPIGIDLNWIVLIPAEGWISGTKI